MGRCCTNALLTASTEAWKNNVTINVISPGPVSHLEQLDEAIHLTNRNKEWINSKYITPQDIAETVLFLCSDDAAYISGTEINFKCKLTITHNIWYGACRFQWSSSVRCPQKKVGIDQYGITLQFARHH
jgi:hypothetical protein